MIRFCSKLQGPARCKRIVSTKYFDCSWVNLHLNLGKNGKYGRKIVARKKKVATHGSGSQARTLVTLNQMGNHAKKVWLVENWGWLMKSKLSH